METRKHPILDLIINEDGTLLIYRGKPVHVKVYKRPRDNYSFKRCCFANRTHTIAKLVCEAFNGMRENLEDTVCRKDGNPNNDHYTNLYWGHRGSGVRTIRTKRSKTSAIKKSEIPQIIKKILAGETLRNIALFYNTSDMSIYRIKKRFLTDKTAMLKNQLKNCRNQYQTLKIYAAYLGFKNVSEAFAAYGGKTNFEQTITKIYKEL
jgi:hypothetical protein